MSRPITSFNVRVELDSGSFPVENKNVIWDSTNEIFSLGAAGADELNVYDQVPFYTSAERDQYIVFSPINDGNAAQLSGSSDFTATSYKINSNTDTVQELRIQSSSKNIALASYTPFRLHETNAGGDGISSYEYVAHETINLGSPGFQPLFRIRIPPYSHQGTDSTVLSSFNAIKIEHVAHVTSSGVEQTQYVTTTMAWTKNSSNTLLGLRVTAQENVRIPLNKSIFDLKTITGSFSGGTLIYTAYHYGVNAEHRIKYTLI